MSIQVIKTLGDGRRYMKTWPMVRQLSYYFPEYRVVKATRLAMILMPVLGLLAASSQVYIHGWDFLPQAITIALFFLSLPIQGLFWLGWRARHPLPLSLLDWCEQLTAKLSSMGVKHSPLGPRACYLDMALLLKAAVERLDNTYWQEL